MLYMKSDKYEFKGFNGDLLVGRLESPDTEIKAFAVFAHCFTCTKDFVASRMIAQALAKEGIATLRFDFTGLGNSQGDFGNTSFTSNVEDLVCATEALAQTHQAPKLIVGHSLGGAAILAAAHQIESAKAIVTLCAPFAPSHVTHLFTDSVDEIKQKGSAEVNLFGRDFKISEKFLTDIEAQNQEQRIHNLHKALLVMHAPTDQMVGLENAQMIFAAARHPKSFISLDGMEHLLQDPDDVAYLSYVLSAWAARYI